MARAGLQIDGLGLGHQSGLMGAHLWRKNFAFASEREREREILKNLCGATWQSLEASKAINKSPLDREWPHLGQLSSLVSAGQTLGEQSKQTSPRPDRRLQNDANVGPARSVHWAQASSARQMLCGPFVISSSSSSSRRRRRRRGRGSTTTTTTLDALAQTPPSFEGPNS